MMMRTLASVAFGALAACAPQQVSETVAAPAVRLYSMDCGAVSMADAGIFADNGVLDGQAREAVDPCYLIRHPDGDLMWDVGLPDSIASAPNGEVVSGPLTLRASTGLASQLAQLSMSPADVEFVSISHSHFDHVGNAAMFTASTWLLDADERAWMFRDEARGAAEFGLIAPIESAPTRLIEGDGDTDVFGDGSVTIIQAPGHTPGHSMLLVRLPNAGPVLLTGDLYHMPESRAQRLVPRFNVDRAQTLASMDKVDALEAQGVRVIRQHVAEDFVALPRFPEALD